MLRTHPEMIVQKTVYGDAINTKTEIYCPSAEAILNAQLDEVTAQVPDPNDPDDGPDDTSD